MGSVGQFRSSGATCTSGRRSNGQQQKKNPPVSFFLHPNSNVINPKGNRNLTKKRGYRTMTKHKRYGGQQTRGLYPHPEFTSPAYNCSRVRSQREKKIISKQSPVVGKRERKQNKKYQNPPVGFFFLLFRHVYGHCSGDGSASL